MSESEELKTLHEKTRRYLGELDIEYSVKADWYRVQYNSTAIIINPREWRDNETFLRILGIVLKNVKKEGNEAMFEEFSKNQRRYPFWQDLLAS